MRVYHVLVRQPGGMFFPLCRCETAEALGEVVRVVMTHAHDCNTVCQVEPVDEPDSLPFPGPQTDPSF